MISTVLALVVLVAVTGCDARDPELDNDGIGTPNRTLAPILPKDVWLPLLQATTLAPVRPKVVGPSCSSTASLHVPAGGSVTFTSPILPSKGLRATYNVCGWEFISVSGSTFSLTCQSFSLSGRDTYYVYIYKYRRPFVYRFRGQGFPSRVLVDATKARVLFLYDQSGNQGYFSCTITASGETTPVTTPSTTSTTTSGSSSNAGASSTSTTTSSTSSSTTTTSTTTVAPTSNSCKCGIVNRTTRIVGGQNAQLNEYPWQVGVLSASSRFVFCGGSLINDRYVVTAAHCMSGRTTSSFRLLLGGHTKNSPSSTERIVRPLRIITHPQYKVGTSNNNDISIIEIAPLDFNNPSVVARPVCLPDSAEDYTSVTATVTGWGTLSSGGSQPNILQEVNIPIVSNAFCRSVYGSAITSSMICAGTTAGGTDSCQGDSGGPLIAPDGANYELIGVVSFGSGCGDPGVPGVYARVTTLQSWIESTIAGSTTCGR